jgi:hypothetical protein
MVASIAGQNWVVRSRLLQDKTTFYSEASWPRRRGHSLACGDRPLNLLSNRRPRRRSLTILRRRDVGMSVLVHIDSSPRTGTFFCFESSSPNASDPQEDRAKITKWSKETINGAFFSFDATANLSASLSIVPRFFDPPSPSLYPLGPFQQHFLSLSVVLAFIGIKFLQRLGSCTFICIHPFSSYIVRE